MPAGTFAQPRRRALILGALAVVVALVIGYLGGLLTPRLSTPGDDSPETGFARDMSAHHAQAVELAMLAWQKSTNADVRELAYNIATGQQAQIGIMAGWLNQFSIIGFPLGYYMAAQGSLAIFVIEIAVYALLMNKKDLEYGIIEGD